MNQLTPLTSTILADHYRPLPHRLSTLPAKLASFMAEEITNPAPLPTEPLAHPQIASPGPVRLDNGGSFDMLVYTGPRMQFRALSKTGTLLTTSA